MKFLCEPMTSRGVDVCALASLDRDLEPELEELDDNERRRRSRGRGEGVRGGGDS